jgi:hypothetical protein
VRFEAPELPFDHQEGPQPTLVYVVNGVNPSISTRIRPSRPGQSRKALKKNPPAKVSAEEVEKQGRFHFSWSNGVKPKLRLN